MGIRVETGDYVVCTYQGKADDSPKPYLIKTASVAEGEVSGRQETKDVHRNPTTLTFKARDVVANLGRKPLDGKVFGFDLASRYRGSVDLHEAFPTIHVYAGGVSKSSREALLKSMDYTATRLQSLGLTFLLEGDATEWLVHPKRGKYAGYYRHSSNPENHPHMISVSLGADFYEEDSKAPFAYVLAHELGHALHFQHFTRDAFPKKNASWLNLYLSSVPFQAVTKEDRIRLFKSLVQYGSLREWEVKTSIEEDSAMMKVVLRDMHLASRMRPRDVDVMLSAEDHENLRGLWPTLPSGKTVPEPILTDYATKNVQELFAESFAFYLLGKKLPHSVSKLLESTLQLVKSR